MRLGFRFPGWEEGKQGKQKQACSVAEDPAHAQLVSRVSKVTFPEGGGVREGGCNKGWG